ncbi:hypothetical protein ABWK57_04210 [Streptomyces sp. NPDC094045]|uniref:hypothetical protein n=1 Tax=unclassified Streptomyces TaxID=2593676 RepID=UPI0033919B0A
MSRSLNTSTAGSAGVIVSGRANSPCAAAGRRPPERLEPAERFGPAERLGADERFEVDERLDADEPKRLPRIEPAAEPSYPRPPSRRAREERLFVRVGFMQNLP